MTSWPQVSFFKSHKDLEGRRIEAIVWCCFAWIYLLVAVSVRSADGFLLGVVAFERTGRLFFEHSAISYMCELNTFKAGGQTQFALVLIGLCVCAAYRVEFFVALNFRAFGLLRFALL